jgi:molecular chaperone HscB
LLQPGVLDFTKNHFALFGLPVSYRVDDVLLAERYRTLQHVLHPDRYATASEREKRLSMQASVHVNDAFRTLRDPVERAGYLLALHGGDSIGGKETAQDTAFLMEQMELREALAEVKDRPDPYAAVGALLGRLADQSDDLVKQLESRLESPSAQDLEEAEAIVSKLRFVAKCRGEAENLEAELEELL